MIESENIVIRKVHLRSWLLLRLLPPLLLGAGVLHFRQSSPFMETLTGAVWIGAIIHFLGWFTLCKHRAFDALAFLPLLLFYSRISDAAFHGGNFPADWLTTAITAFSIYLVVTLTAWLTPAKQSQSQRND